MNKPNIILITTDQQRFDTIHALGNMHIYTPHLNWLADEGIAFTRCYSDCPICMPARATIMTGKHGYTHGLMSNSNVVIPMKNGDTLPAVLTREGYQTRAQGKMHFEPIRANYGFEHMELPLDYYRFMDAYPELGIPKGHGVGENEIEPVISTVDEIHSATRWVVKRSIDFIETRDDTRPFFLWTSFAKPHPPFDPSYHYWALYQNKELPPPVYGDWSEKLSFAPQGFYRPTYMLNNAYRMSQSQLLDVKRAYYACITQIDYSLGLLFARLREMNLLDNTWIIFTSDHGDMMGDHHMCAKSVFLEGSAHIPMIVRPPRDTSLTTAAIQSLTGARCETIVTLADVAPTILAIAGAREPDGMDGANMLDLATENAGAGANAGTDGGSLRRAGADRIFYGACDSYYSIIKDDYKYLWTNIGDEELLFNLKTDPQERINLAKDEAETVACLKQMLADKMATCCNEAVYKEFSSIKDAITGPREVNKWPGFHSTGFPTDVLH